jgi:hypothetical protein
MPPPSAPLGALADATPFYAPLGEMLRDGDERVCCHLCGRWMKAVGGTHLRSHGWTIDAYREAFQLPAHTPMYAHDLSTTLRRAAKRRVGRDGFGTPPPWPGAPKPSPTWRSLEHVRPGLVSELHPTRNADLNPVNSPLGHTASSGGAAPRAGTSGRRRW